MISTVHVIFWGLQAPPQLRNGCLRLTPSSVIIIFAWTNLLTIHGQHVSAGSGNSLRIGAYYFFQCLTLVLCMYEGLKSDCVSDPLLLADLDESKLKLKIFHQQNYAWGSQSTNSRPSQSLSSVIVRTHSSISRSPEKVTLTSRYQMKDRIMIHEIDEYFKLPWEIFESCKSLQ